MLRRALLLVLLLILGPALARDAVFSVQVVGESNNTQTVFLEVTSPIPGSTCANAKSFRLAQNDPLADSLFAAAMTAFVANKRLRVYYDETVCLSEGVVVQAFRLEH